MRHTAPTPPRLNLPKEHQRLPGIYWRPSEAFADELAQELKGQRVLEIFAGNGYLAAMLARRGIDIMATSLLTGMDNHAAGLYHPVESMDAVSAVLAHGAERDALLICWPTVTPAALLACEAWGSDRPIAYIGEVTDYELGHLGGCATDDFFTRLSQRRELASYQGNRMEKALMARLSPLNPDARAAPPARRPGA